MAANIPLLSEGSVNGPVLQSTAKDVPDDEQDGLTPGGKRKVLCLVDRFITLGAGFRCFFPPWCCVARGWDPKNNSSSQLHASRCTPNLFMQTQAVEWKRLFRGEAAHNIAIPCVGAQSLLKQRQKWTPEENLVHLVEPHFRDWGNIFAEPLSFNRAFPWFPTAFPWKSSSAGITLVMKGGAAAHMLHKRGFGDLDFCLYKHGDEALLGRKRSNAIALVGKAVSALCHGTTRTLLMQTPDMLTLMFELNDGSVWRVQFLLHIFRSISEIMISSDLDVTQVVYCGATDKEQGLYISPLALEAYASGFMTIRSRPIRSTQRRIKRYVLRGFGVRSTGDMVGTEGLQQLHAILHDEMNMPDEPTVFIDTSCSGPDVIGEDFAKHEDYLKPIQNQILCNTLCKCAHGCVAANPWWNGSAYNMAQHFTHFDYSWWNGVAYNMAQHLTHFDFKRESSTRQFILKEDKCSLPSVGILLHTS